LFSVDSQTNGERVSDPVGRGKKAIVAFFIILKKNTIFAITLQHIKRALSLMT